MLLVHGQKKLCRYSRTSLAKLSDLLSGSDTRLLVVGGAGSLYVNPEHTAAVAEGANFQMLLNR